MQESWADQTSPVAVHTAMCMLLLKVDVVCTAQWHAMSQVITRSRLPGRVVVQIVQQWSATIRAARDKNIAMTTCNAL